MMKFLNKYKYLFLTFLTSFIIFYPSLFVFFTNDDFFFLKISQVKSVAGFLNFFNLIKGPDGFGMYRPLTTQVFYFLGEKLFNTNPFYIHLISFFTFFGIIYLIYKLGIVLFKSSKVALISAFLYAVSATHFGHLYYLSTFQELGMTFFVLLSCLAFLKNKNLLSFIFFILALTSKETAVVTPLLLASIYLFKRKTDSEKVNFRELVLRLFPFLICLAVYLFIRFRSYGFASGNTYIWDFSIKKLLNTAFWYLLWSLNIPEALVDFVGPGLKINPNLFLFWSKQILPILFAFLAECLILAGVLIRVLFENAKKEIKERDLISVFCIGLFLISLLPVIFLPLHKFAFYLTLPLIGLVFRIAYLLESSKVNNLIVMLFILLWTGTSIFTLKFTFDTSWISRGEIISESVNNYFSHNKASLLGKNIYFVDTQKDLALPWSPTATVLTVLSNKNFFDVFYPDLTAKVTYSGIVEVPASGNNQIIESRQFLGY